jgi:L-lactate dehydrogenase complex protein LldG
MNIRIEWLERLESELTLLQARTYRAASPEELRETLEGICRPYDRSAIAREDRPALRDLAPGFSVFPAQEKGAWRSEHWRSFQEIQVGITGTDYALADTGTLVLLSGNSGGRWLSLAPPLHVALLPADRILPGLDDFLDLFPSGEALLSLGSAVTFISGASRTADIELNLVHGAHGPKELHVITLLFPV